LLSLAFAGAALLGSATLYAQPERDHRGPDHDRDHRAPPPPAATGPTEAPPTSREERQAARAGFTWITGRWDWKGKWDWIPGHWERERAGKMWRAGHWDKNGATWAFTDGAWVDAGATAPPPPPPPPPTGALPPPPPPPDVRDHRPHQPPPPLRVETPSMKAGFAWIPGRWDWKNDQWAWIDGHWERERAHRKWRPDRWESRGNTFELVPGDWIDENAAITPPPPPPPNGTMPPPPPGGMEPPMPPPGEHHHDWKVERPAVSSYWPAKGKVGTRIVIHGVNFPDNAVLVWGDQPIKAAKITPDKIVFEVPPGATSGTIALRREHGRDLIVGPFEVATYDYEADARRMEDEQRKAAEAEWTARQKDLAKDRAAREAAWRQKEQDLDTTREQRRAERVAAIRAKWAQNAFLADPDTQNELTMHAQRIADLGRAREVAEIASNGKLVVRIDMASNRENERHDQRMAALQAAFSAKGGAP
jgi:hypothetical protein